MELFSQYIMGIGYVNLKFWSCKMPFYQDICAYNDGLVQERRNSIANALELHLSCTNPAI